ncbi:hypothetical protein K6119_15840 [Paracrocinitomix mangrovi]|uniref:hypothetical protein n=1 Tax=Paracrocinitomix mangrovi TaxID=2862509 RepID=UPI001C8EB0D4|nr:hypothetical protein [Paracrocinitomix mangrovi]UKN01202.1 hypothetical protein K6119_15840 [Paracrocinitomix mangrovi]
MRKEADPDTAVSGIIKALAFEDLENSKLAAAATNDFFSFFFSSMGKKGQVQ